MNAPALEDRRAFYLIDAESESYVVGVMARRPDQLRPELAALEVGKTFWTDQRWGWERVS